MSNHGKKILFWAITLIIISACVLPGTAPVVPTIDPQAVITYIAQTEHAAATQTAKSLPTSTPTATFTLTPRNTNTPEPSPTNTVIFILKTPTRIVPTSSSGGSNSGSSGTGGSGGSGSSSTAGYSCELLTVSPANGTSYSPRENFDAVWKVKNSGTKSWDKNSVDFIYYSGDQFHKVSGYDLQTDVSSGSTTTVGADMVAPKTAGSYTTYWALRIAEKNFCVISLTIRVQ
jgi:hypothetical protein